MLDSEYIKIKEIISNIKVNDKYIKDIIFLLSNYITTSNNDYVYNKTYLTSYTDEFINFLNMFLKKQEKIYLIKEYVDKTIMCDNIYINIDLTWEISKNKITMTNLSVNRIVDNRFYIEIIRKDINIIESYYIYNMSLEEVKYKIGRFAKIHKIEREDYERESAI